MSKSSYGERIQFLFVAALLLGESGCGDNPGSGAPSPGPGPVVPSLGPGFAPEAVDTEPLGASPTNKQIMAKLNRGPQSLTPVIGKALEAEPPAWDAITPQTEEYARLATALSKNEPSRGSKESWEKLTTAFAASAQALNKAAQAKDRDAALEAHDAINGSCMECHREHRRGGPGMGGPGMGGPGMGGPGMGGPGMRGPRPRGGPAKGAPPPPAGG
jgi:hypothetical protein